MLMQGSAVGNKVLPPSSSQAVQSASRVRLPAPPAAVVAEEGPAATFDIVTAARQKVSRPPVKLHRVQPGPVDEFVRKLKLAWHIFFPEQQSALSAKEEGKNRLRMILVADRCGMNQSSLFEMKQSIVNVVQDYVDLEAEELVEVNITTDDSLGTVYSVAMPVRRVKAKAALPNGDQAEEEVLTTSDPMEWDLEDAESDPSSRFPYGC